MLNRYPLWKYLLVGVMLLIGFVYSLPNIYPPDPAIQLSGASSALEIDESTLRRAEKALTEAGIAMTGREFTSRSALIRLASQDAQLGAKSVVKRALGDDYVVALNLAPTTPAWLTAIGASPMKLGLDLSGGVHFLLEVDTDSAVRKRLEIYTSDLKKKLREERIRGLVKLVDGRRIEASFANEELRSEAIGVVGDAMPELQRLSDERDGAFVLLLSMTEQQVREMEDYAVAQNLTTLRNRVNELGVAEPLIQKQGRNRIVVELPGVQDTAEAKRILGKTAVVSDGFTRRWKRQESSSRSRWGRSRRPHRRLRRQTCLRNPWSPASIR